MTTFGILKLSPFILDSTGAGDAFNAALVVGLGEGLSLSQAVEQANYAGAYSTMCLGVIDGLATKAQLEAFRRDRKQLHRSK